MNRTSVSPFLDLQHRIDELFEEVIFRRWPVLGRPATGVATWAPRVDLHELADAFFLAIDLPGLSAADVQIDVAPLRIAVSGRRIETPPAGVVASRCERAHGPFRREVGLPIPVDAHRVEVAFQDGVLRILAPKTKPVAAG